MCTIHSRATTPVKQVPLELGSSEERSVPASRQLALKGFKASPLSKFYFSRRCGEGYFQCLPGPFPPSSRRKTKQRGKRYFVVAVASWVMQTKERCGAMTPSAGDIEQTARQAIMLQAWRRCCRTASSVRSNGCLRRGSVHYAGHSTSESRDRAGDSGLLRAGKQAVKQRGLAIV